MEEARRTQGKDSLLASLFEEFQDAFADGRAIDLERSMQEHPQIKEQIQETYELAQEFALQKVPAKPSFEGYEILRELGRGGMGTVYLAQHESLGRQVALKVLPSAVSLSERSKQRFLEEARALARLRDDHIVQIYHVLEHEGTLAFEMEWIEGASLRQVIGQLRVLGHRATLDDLGRILGFDRASQGADSLLHYFVQMGITMARALAKVHQAGLVHRDVKPSNILIRSDGSPMLADFGLVYESDGQGSLTGSGAFVGTPVYAPPEQFHTDLETVDHRADIYALAVTLYEALALVPPFDGRTSNELLKQIELGRVPKLRKLAPQVPKDLETILLKAMEVDPKRRYATASEFADDLQRLLLLQPIKARPAGPVRRAGKFVRRNRRPLLGAVAGSVLVAGVLLPVFSYLLNLSQVDERVAQFTQQARSSLLSREVRPSRLMTGLWGYWNPAQSLNVWQALEAYDQALALKQDPELVLERQLVALVPELPSAGARRRNPAQLVASSRVLSESLAVLGPRTTAAVKQIIAAGAMSRLNAQDMASASPQDRKTLGLLAYLTGNLVICEDAWKGLSAVRKDQPLMDAVLGVFYQLDGRPGLAHPRLRRAVESFPSAQFLTVTLADAILQEGDVDFAKHLLGTLTPSSEFGVFWTAYLARVQADLLLADGEVQQARQGYEDLLRADASFSLAAYRLAQLDLRAGRIHQARNRLSSLVEKFSDVPQYRLALAGAALELDDLSAYLAQARYAVPKALLGNSSPGELQDLLGILRIGGFRRLYERCQKAVSYRQPTLSPDFFGKLPLSHNSSFSSHDVEAVLESFGAFDVDAIAGGWALPSTTLRRQVASNLAWLVRMTLHFPQLLQVLDLPDRVVVTATAEWCRRNWDFVSFRVVPALFPEAMDSTGLAQKTLFSLDGSEPSAGLGRILVGAGDVDGDGLQDIVVGQSSARHSTLGDFTGVVQVYSGRDGSLLHTFEGEAAEDRFGIAVSGAGDLNRDGYGDIVVGAPGWDADLDGPDNILGSSDDVRGNGKVYFYSGKDGSLMHSIAGDKGSLFLGGTRKVERGDALGQSLSGGRSVDMDTIPDVMVCAPGALAVYVFSGVDVAAGRASTTMTAHTFTPVARSGYGMNGTSAGDVNKDGYGDVLVGLPHAAVNGRSQTGSVIVYSGRDGSTIHQIDGSLAKKGPRFGMRVSAAGDINLDGYDDFIAAEGQLLKPYKRGGAVYVYSGRDKSLLASFIGGETGTGSSVTGDYLGAALTAVGDLNGDDYPDIAVGAPNWHRDAANGIMGNGRVYLYSGRWIAFRSGPRVLCTFEGEHGGTQGRWPQGDELGSALAGVGDINQDGLIDLVISAPQWDGDPVNGLLDSGRIYICSGF